jgi:1-deoxyxylulose-5-phosphate synthase
MSRITRRDFIKHTAGTVVATTTLYGSFAAAQEPAVSTPAAALRRALGKTGLSCTRLGMGTGTRSWNKNSAQIRKGRDIFLNTLTHAYDRGIRYFDLADMYGSHEYLRDVMVAAGIKREELFILSKVTSKTAEELRTDLDRMRKDLSTDYFDAVLLHCMTSGEWPEQMAECMDVLDEAKEKGIIKAKGVSCHHMHALQSAAKIDWVDIVLARINPYGTHMDGTPEETVNVLREARSNGKGVIGMKILGEGRHADEKEACLKYAMELDCIDAFTIGFLEAKEVDEIVDFMDRFATV